MMMFLDRNQGVFALYNLLILSLSKINNDLVPFNKGSNYYLKLENINYE